MPSGKVSFIFPYIFEDTDINMAQFAFPLCLKHSKIVQLLAKTHATCNFFYGHSKRVFIHLFQCLGVHYSSLLWQLVEPSEGQGLIPGVGKPLTPGLTLSMVIFFMPISVLRLVITMKKIVKMFYSN